MTAPDLIKSLMELRPHLAKYLSSAQILLLDGFIRRLSRHISQDHQ